MTSAIKLYQPQHLEQWTMPDSYIGPSHYGTYYFLGKNRDSDILTQSNFECGLELLGGESETVQVIRDRHWACGWIEYILIHESDIKSLQVADEIAAALEDYPVVDEFHYSEFEHEQVFNMTTDHMSYFLSDLLKAADTDMDSLTPELQNELEQFIYFAVSEDAAYRGADEAWFRVDDLERVLDEAASNHFDISTEAMAIINRAIKG
jgi:hypothetical protein